MVEAQLIQHVVHRGINRQRIFADELDKRRFLRIISREFEKRRISLWAFCLMDNHFHLLLYDADGFMSQALQVVISAYTLSYNLRHGCEGALLRGRFYSVPVRDTRYILEVQRYIHRNPLVAKMVETSDQYIWSSYHHYLRSIQDKLVDTRPVLTLLRRCGVTPSLFSAWTDQGIFDGADQPNIRLTSAEQSMLTQSASSKLWDGVHIENHAHGKGQLFAALVEGDEERRQTRLTVVDRWSQQLGIAAADLLVTSRGKKVSLFEARCSVMLACQKEADASISELAQTFGVCSSSVGKMVRKAKSGASDPRDVVAMQGIEPRTPRL